MKKVNPLNAILRASQQTNNRTFKIWFRHLLVALFTTLSFLGYGQISNMKFTANTITYAEITGGTSLVAGGNVTLGAASAVTPIGFTFNYLGQNYDGFSVNAAGLLKFNFGSTAPYNTAVTTENANNPASATNLSKLYPWWDATYVGSAASGGGISYVLSGTAPNRVLTVQWKLAYTVNTAVAMSYQVKLYETSNKIEYYYGATAPTAAATASVGMTGMSPYEFLDIVPGPEVLSNDYWTTIAQTSFPTNRKYEFLPQTITTQPSASALSPTMWLKANQGAAMVAYTMKGVTAANMSSNGTDWGAPTWALSAGALSATTAGGWLASAATGGQGIAGVYLQMDLGSVQAVDGVATRGGGTSGNWVTDYTVKISSDNINWTNLGLFKGNEDATTIFYSDFPTQQTARYIRVYPAGYNGWRALRVDAYTKTTTAATDGQKVSLWNDQSVTGFDAYQITAANQLTYKDNQINFNPALVSSNAANTWMNFPDLNNIRQSFWVVQDKTATGTNYFHVLFGNTAHQPYFHSGTPGQLQYNGVATDANQPFRLDGAAATMTSSYDFGANGNANLVTAQAYGNSPTSATQLSYQAGNTRSWEGPIAEVITYENNLSTAQVTEVETYLAIKYGITQGQNYVAPNGTILWDKTANATYHNNVFGIGRNDAQGLHQRQSKSVNATGFLTIGNNSIIGATNATSVGNDLSTDNTYLLLGDNGGDLLYTPNGQYAYLGRKWKVSNTGVTGNVKVSAPAAGNTNYWNLPTYNPQVLVDATVYIVVDPNGDGNLSDATYTATTLTGGGATASYDASLALPNGAVISYAVKLKDADNDGVYDVADLDDDNDGVLDTTEASSFTFGERLPNTINFSDPANLATDSRTSTSLTINGNVATAWSTSYSKDTYKLPIHLEYLTNATGQAMIGFVPSNVTKVYNNWNDASSLKFYHTGTSVYGKFPSTAWNFGPTTVAATNLMVIDIDAIGQVTAKINGTVYYTGVAPITDYYFTVSAYDLSPSKTFTSLKITDGSQPVVLAATDTDSDNISNWLDLDSDGDGCSDAKEAGATTSTTANFKFTTGFGTNGLADAVETIADNGIVNYNSTYANLAVAAGLSACLDTDGDTVSDYFDIDDDNDGVLDAVESPSCFAAITDWNANFKMGDVKITTALTMPAGFQDVAGLTNNTFTSGVKFNTQAQLNQELFKFTFGHPTKLDALYIKTQDATNIFGGAVMLQGSNDNTTWTNLQTAAALPAIANNNNTTTNNIPNTTPVGTNPLANTLKFAVATNAATYKYYRIYGTATANTAAGVATEVYFDINAASYQASYYANPTACTVDTDNDGTPNHLDTDSDGDGCNDAIEAAGYTIGTTIPVAGITASNYGANGFVDAKEQTAAESGLFNGTYTYNFATNAAINACVDSDGDSVGDAVDLDDDNDGVLDTQECSMPVCNTVIVNGGFELPVVTANSTTMVYSGMSGWRTSATDNAIEVWRNTYLGKTAAEGVQFAELNGTQNALLYQKLCVSPGSVISYSVKHRGKDGVDVAEVQFGADPLNATTVKTMTDGATAWGTHTGTYTIPGNQNETYIVFKAVSSSSSTGVIAGNLLDDVQITVTTQGSCDTDLDGIPNTLDPDSDNDGCNDAVESGAYPKGTPVPVAGTTASNYGANGFVNAKETTPESGVYNGTYTYEMVIATGFNACTDSDNDGISDVFDIDDDNDGVLDRVECEIPICTNTLTNGSFESPGISGYGVMIPNGSASGWFTTDVANNVIEYWSGSAAAGSQFVELNAYTASALYQKLCGVPPGTVINWSVKHRGRDGVDVADVKFGPTLATAKTVQTMEDGTTVWGAYSGTYTVPAGQNETYIYFEARYSYGGNISAGNFIDDVQVSIGRLGPCVRDTDGDGIMNSLDPDSDNDGCNDAVEGAGYAVGTAVPVAGTGNSNYGANGFVDAKETTPESGVFNETYTYTSFALTTFTNLCVDSDNDGIPDFNDIDDDNDGVLDNVESPSCYFKANEWNTAVKSDFVTITSQLNLLAPNTNFAALNDNDATVAAIQFATATAQSQIGKELFKMKFRNPVQLDAIYIKKTSATQIFAATASSLMLQGSNDNSTWTDLLTTAIASPADASNTTANGAVVLANSNKFTVATNAGQYKYYRIFGVGTTAANILSGVASEFYFDVNTTKYVGSYFQNNTCTNDTDGDGILNHLDPDSDGDGCNDAIEGAGYPVGTAVPVAGTGNTNYGANGFVNAKETATESGLFNGTYKYGYAINSGMSLCVDSDSDGVADALDLDDDNDGVLDNIECNTYPKKILFAGSAEDFAGMRSNWFADFRNAAVPGATIVENYTIESATVPAGMYDGYDMVVFGGAAVNTVHVNHFNALKTAMQNKTSKAFVIQMDNCCVAANSSNTMSVLNTVFGTNYALSTAHPLLDETYTLNSGNFYSDVFTTNSLLGANYFPILNVADSDILFYSPTIAGSALAGLKTLPNTNEQNRFVAWFVDGSITQSNGPWYPANTGKIGKAFYEAYAAKAPRTCDTDNDGTPNHLDSDSDGDGCNDAIEGAGYPVGTAVPVAGTTPSNYGANGFVNTKETATESGLFNGVYTYTYATSSSTNLCTDTDNDGVSDFVDLDDDNDGVLDITEMSCVISQMPNTGVIITKPGTINYTFNGAATMNNMIDGVDNNNYVISAPTGTLNGEWFRIQLPTPKALNYFEVGHYSGQTLFTVGTTYKIEGSNDATNWTNVSGTLTYNNNSKAVSGGYSNFNSNVATFTNETAYTYYRVVGINAVSGGTWATELYFKQKVCTDIDTDGDGIVNRLDPDSDGDGCNDAIEAGVYPIGTTVPVAGTTASNYGANGFVNAKETATESGLFTGTYTYTYAVNATANMCIDSDGDGVADVVDLDDDNDGIYDSVECACPAANTTSQVIAPSAIVTIPTNAFGLSSWGSYSNLAYDGSGLSATPTTEASLSTITHSSPTLITNAAYTSDGTSITLDWKFTLPAASDIKGMALWTPGSAAYGGGDAPMKKIKVSWTDCNNVVKSQTFDLGTPSPRANVVYFNEPILNVTNFTFDILEVWYDQEQDLGASNGWEIATPATVNSSFNVTLGEIRFIGQVGPFSLACSTDTDGDGIVNSLDQDSDGDGCNDANEYYNSSTASGTDNNGYYGNGNPPAVNANGTVTSASYTGNYTKATTVGSVSTITTQPLNQSIQVTQNASFTVAASGGAGVTSYQWQVSTDAGVNWTNLTNTGVYTGATTTALTLTNVPISMQLYRYRVIISESNYVCGTTTSAAAKLLIGNMPNIQDDVKTILEDAVATGNVLTNDAGSGGSTLTLNTFTVAGQTYQAGQAANIPGVGTVVVNANGTYTFTPVANYNGTVPAIDYAATDTNGGSDTGTLTISVIPVNDLPSVVGETTTTPFNTNVTGNVLANDTDTESSALLITQFTVPGVQGPIVAGQPATIPGKGVLTINSDGSYNFVPDANFSGPVPTATYTVSDGTGGTNTGTLGITVTPAPTINPPAAPVPTDGTYTAGATGNPTTIASTVPAAPTGQQTLYCDANGANCSTTAPALPTAPGVYPYCVKYKDLTTNLESACATDNITILPTPPVPTGGTYTSGATGNPTTIASTVPAAPAGQETIYCDANGANCSNVAPALPTTPGAYQYCIKYKMTTSPFLESTPCVLETVTILPAPPVPTGGTYTTGASGNPTTIAPTVPSAPTGQETIYCDANGANCSTTAPALPTLPGVYQYCVKYRMTTSPNLESTPCVLETVTIKPLAPSVADVAYCQNATAIALTATPSTNGTLNWYTAATGGTASSTAPTPITTYPGPTDYFVSQTVNGVESDRAKITVTVNGLPASALASTVQPTCSVATGTITVTNTTVTGDTYSIDGVNYQSSKIFNNVATGTYSVTIKNATGCVSVGTSVVINAQPTAPATPTVTRSSAGNICSGGSTTFTSSLATSYQWYDANGPIAGAINRTYTAYAAGSYSVKVTNAAGCESQASTPETLTVVAGPTGTISQGSVLAMNGACNGNPISLSLSTSQSGLSFQWIKDGVDIQGATAQSYSATSAGLYQVRITNSACTSTTEGTRIIPAANVTTNVTPTVCAGGSIGLKVDASQYSNAATYQWQKYNTGNSTWENISGANASTYNATTSGDYRVEVVDGTTATSCPTTITVNALPIVSVTSNPTGGICAGSNATLTAIATGAATLTYQWQIGGVAMSAQTASTLSVGIAGDYSVKVTDGNGCAVTSSPLTLAVNALPAAATISVTDPSCASPSGTITVTAPTGSGYTYSIDNSTFTNTTGIFTNLTSGNYDVFVRNSNGCVSPASAATIAAAPSAPAQPGTISGNSNPFQGSTQTYSITAVTGATSYQWTLPNGWTGTSGSISIQTVVGSVYGNITVSAVNSAGCAGPAATLAVQTKPVITAPDVNNGLINKAITGSVATNDITPTGTTYGTPVASGSNPTGATLTMQPNGTYSFQASTPGVYTYDVPVCAAGQTTGCPTVPLTITVVDPIAANVAPAVNADLASTKAGVAVTTNVLANDICENPNCTLSNPTITTQPAHGTAVVNSDGTITYTPAAGFVGTDVLTYQVCDNTVNPTVCKTATVTYTVEPTAAPARTTASDDVVTTNGTNPATGNVLNNDASTASGATLTVTTQNTTIPNKGTILLNADGTYTFTPVAGFTGTVDIPYTVCDNANPANCSTATLHVVVEPAPTVLTPDFNNGLINSPITGNLSTNDELAPGSTYGTPVAANTNPSGATFTVNPNGTYTFQATTPGVYTYNVPVCPAGQTTNCPMSPITITVVDPLAANVAPAVNPDIATVKDGSSVTTNVLANDICENPNCTLSNPTITTQPAHGTAVVNSDGTITYTPTPGYSGTDVLTYQVCDNTVNPAVCKTATVTYTVEPSNAPPTTTASDDAVRTTGDYPATGNVLRNDVSTDPNSGLVATAQNTTIAGKGTLVMNTDGSYTFTPVPGFTGTLDLPYTVCDSHTPANCATATLHVVVEPAAPVIAPDFNNGLINSPIAGSLATNDVIAGGGNYGTPVAANTNPTGATFTVNSDGTYNFQATTPGVYTYNVPVCPAGQTTNCPMSPITITVVDPLAASVAPAVNPDIATVKDGSSVTTNVLANDVCQNANCSLNPASVQVTSNPAHGTVVVNSDGTITYTPTAGYTGTDVLTYQVCDNTVNPAVCKTATVTYTVEPSNAPATTTASDDAAVTNGNYPATGNVLSNDASTNPNAVLAVTPQNTVIPNKGTIVMNADGTYTFTPAPGFSGTLDIPYTVCDNANPTNCATATLHVVVEPVASFVNDINATNIGVPVNGNVSTNDDASGTTYGTPIAANANPTGASISMNPDGTYAFTASTPGTYLYEVPNCLAGQTSGCATTQLVITVKDPNSLAIPPVVNPDVATVLSGSSVTTNVMANDLCSNQACTLNPASVAIMVQPSHGTVLVNSDGTLTYTPASGFVGTDVITYQVCDNSTPALCKNATVTYTVLAPGALASTSPSDDYTSTKGNAVVSGNVLTNDASTNPNAVLSVTPQNTTIPNKGTIEMNADGTYTFTPAAGFAGTLEVPYTVCDNANPANCADATLHIVVDPAPTATNDVISSATNGVFTTNILANDQIQPGTGVTITRQTGAGAGTAQGTVSFDPLTGAVIYTPSVNDGNTVTIGYTVCDTHYTPAQCASATITVQVCDPANQGMDCDGDGVTNGQEVIDGTNPADPCSMKSTSQTLTPNSLWMAADCDGDGVINGTEKANGTDPIDPCSYIVSSQTFAPSNAWLTADCDGDGTPNGTDEEPLNFCVGGVVGQIPPMNSPAYNQYFKNGDCDGDGITNEMETNVSGLPIDTDYDGIPNYLDLDSDNDGIPDAVEQNIDSDGDGIANYQDLDSDNDGISDRIEGVADPDGDGIPNYLDLDSDGDVLKDAWEALPIYVFNRDDNYDGRIDKNGVFTDANSNGWADISEGSVPTDTDKDGTPDYLDLDSDNDCIPDGIELTNDPDQDGVQNYRDTDSDGDGLSDTTEAGDCNNPVDTDGDGKPDYVDNDSDNDGIPDNVEGTIDTDGDGIPNFRDLDSDGDGIPDAIEAGADPKHPVDTDGDGTPDYLDLDSDNDGIPDAIEAGKDPKNPVDTDKDGTPDYLDLDSDNDGIPDAIEAGKDPKNPVDTDGDGTPDFQDLDSDNDGIPDAIEAGKDPKNPVDTDGDGTPDYLDLDSDNDGIPDAIEAGKDPKNPVDTDGDGTPDFRDLDSDNDGIPDAIEAGKDPKNPVDTDGDGTPDFRDLDSDNDGIPDKIEAGNDPKNPVDTDGDGTPDFRDLDSDNDGISDKIEAGSNPNNPVDTDGDGTPDFRDLDSDNDGISDKIEGNVDTDGDGTPDFRDIDSDNDGYLDKVEGNVDTDKDGTPDFRDLDSDGDSIVDKLENDIDYGGMPDCDGDGVDNRIDPDQCPTFATQGLSPNNDGINDVLIIPGIKSNKNHLTIFNRWGNVVWEQENYQNNWGGETNQGDTVLSTDLKLPDGTYYYVIDYYGVKPSVGTYVYINRQAK